MIIIYLIRLLLFHLPNSSDSSVTYHTCSDSMVSVIIVRCSDSSVTYTCSDSSVTYHTCFDSMVSVILVQTQCHLSYLFRLYGVTYIYLFRSTLVSLIVILNY